ncbi:glycosyltransferase [Marinilabilia rubra]|uniref:Chondroitin polymerase n=1 Tax=Marinilabilia rubra TaxID=2162893 RepID=A0A2U2B8Q6_9BACT|nr:glycosyltransferase [Marinilabilia rubra]PWD99424.1 Chondroitin polymerase [Marinilabilia rubra]
MFNASIIISFYNDFSTLKTLLEAFEKQSEPNFEVVIADDGSKEEVVSQIKQIINCYPFRIQHVWQEDSGFRKTRILNKAIVASKSDYLVFIDGDCIPHKHFVKDHLVFRSPDIIIAGRRVNISESLKQHFLKEQIKEKSPLLFFLRLIWDSITGKTRDIEKGIRVPIKFINKKFGKFNRGILGANFSLYKSALIEINGFDMRYEKPFVGEDTDLEYRLRLTGKKVFSPRFRAVQYHFIHNRQNRISETENLEILKKTKETQQAFTPLGIDELP